MDATCVFADMDTITNSFVNIFFFLVQISYMYYFYQSLRKILMQVLSDCGNQNDH